MDFLALAIIGFSIILVPLLVIVFFLALSSIKIVNQYERGVKFTLGKYAGIMKPRIKFCNTYYSILGKS